MSEIIGSPLFSLIGLSTRETIGIRKKNAHENLRAELILPIYTSVNVFNYYISRYIAEFDNDNASVILSDQWNSIGSFLLANLYKVGNFWF